MYPTLAPSRQIPTAYDSVIDSTDVPLLEHAYHLDGSRVAALIKFLAAQYGPSIPYPSLRQAILVLSASLRPGQYHDQRLVHGSRAYNILASKISAGTKSFNDADVFASFILSYATAKRTEMRHHIVGCELMRLSLENSTAILNVFAPIFKDAVINESMYSLIPPTSRATFLERIECFRLLGNTGTPEWAWRYHELDTMLYTLTRALVIGHSSITLGFLHEDEHRNRLRVEFAKVQMDIETQDEEFQKELAKLKMKIQMHTSEFKTLDQQLEAYTLLQNEYVAFMRMILEFPTVFDAYNDPQVSSTAHYIFLYWKSRGIRRIKYFDAGYCQPLQLVAFAVSNTESKHLATKRTNFV
jgi:hypothetical protein